MAVTDHITKKGKRQMVTLLNRILQVEYSFIINYPRIIDQISLVEGLSDEDLFEDLERLGKESTTHLGIVGDMIECLGGRVDWRPNAVERMVDLATLFEQQVRREKAAESMYDQAVRIARDNPVKSLGVFETIRRALGFDLDLAHREHTIRRFERIAGEERDHLRLLEDMLAAYKSQLGRIMQSTMAE